MKLNLLLSLGCAMLLGLPTVRGQSASPDVLNNSGGFGVIDNNVFEWSIGEFVVSTQTHASVIVTQGLLQPMDGPAFLPEDTKMASLLDVFPNPATSIININFNAPSDGTLTYRLMDVTGKLIQENNAEVRKGNSVRQLDIRTLACATYMLQVLFTTNGTPSATTYKIQKLN